ncbi:MarR family transcriptional regulator, partial [Lactobacillus rhamnosus]|nr:MarR family transcriptional regulator [Lacticaseibacillus rhamnosus]
DNSADDISLVLSFTDTNDERIEEAVAELQERRLQE